MRPAVELGGIVSLRQSGFPQLFLFSSLRFQGKNAWMSAGLAPGRRALLEVPCQPFPRIELRQRQRGKDREGRRRQLTTPGSTPSRRSSSGPPPDPARRSEALLSIGIRGSSTNRVSPSQCACRLSRAFRQGVARSARASSVSICAFIWATACRRQPSASRNAAEPFSAANRRRFNR